MQVLSWLRPIVSRSKEDENGTGPFPAPLWNLQPTLARMPLKLDSPVSSVQIVSPASLSVSIVEGPDSGDWESPWECTAKVADASGDPLPNKVVMLVVAGSPGIDFPLLYRPDTAPRWTQINQPVNKQLRFTQNVTTDAEGLVTIRAQFGSAGRAGEYKVLMICDGVQSALPIVVTVASSVANVKISIASKGTAREAINLFNDSAVVGWTPVLSISTSTMRGVENKNATVRAVDKDTGKEVPKDMLDIVVVPLSTSKDKALVCQINNNVLATD